MGYLENTTGNAIRHRPWNKGKLTAEIEEERRLLYVAMTRAKDDLHLIVPQRFFTHGQNAKGDRHLYASRTRFIPDGLLYLFDKLAACCGRRFPARWNSRRTHQCRRPHARDVAIAMAAVPKTVAYRPGVASLAHQGKISIIFSYPQNLPGQSDIGSVLQRRRRLGALA
jgi:hypothetical protein